jgi:hypothetical protein
MRGSGWQMRDAGRAVVDAPGSGAEERQRR